MLRSYIVFLMSLGFCHQIASADVQPSVMQQKFSSITDVNAPIVGFLFGKESKLAYHDLSQQEINLFVVAFEAILKSQVNVGTFKNQSTGEKFRYTDRDIRVVPDIHPQHIVTFQKSTGQYRTNKMALTGPFYMETSDQFCRIFNVEIKDFSTRSLLNVPLWFESGSIRTSMDCVNKDSSSAGVHTYSYVVSNKPPEFTESTNYP